MLYHLRPAEQSCHEDEVGPTLHSPSCNMSQTHSLKENKNNILIIPTTNMTTPMPTQPNNSSASQTTPTPEPDDCWHNCSRWFYGILLNGSVQTSVHEVLCVTPAALHPS